MGNGVSSSEIVPSISYVFYSLAEAVSCAVNNAIHHGEYDPKHIENASNRLNLTLANIEARTASMRIKALNFANQAVSSNRKKSRSEALHFMRLKKMYDREVEKMMKIKFSIESNLLQIESAGVILDTVTALKDTGGRIKGISKSIDLSRIEQDIDSIFEYKESSNELEEVLSDTFRSDGSVQVTDDELLAELDDLTAGEENRVGPETISPVENKDTLVLLPEAPDGPIPNCELTEAPKEVLLAL